VSERRVLITGAGGYIGTMLGAALVRERVPVIGTDVRARHDPHYPIHQLDVRESALGTLLKTERITHVVHLATVLEGKGNRALEYDIDVNGTRNVVECCLFAKVKHLTVSSSGAAYGYHADNPPLLTEEHPLRATPAFAYAHHKRLVEEMLAAYRKKHPALAQLIFRISTVLGARTKNQITALFEKKRLLAIRGSESPFVFVWDEDVVGAMLHGIRGDRTGVYNLAGDGALTIREIAAALGKRTQELPAGVLRWALRVGRALGVSRYGPEQLDFLRYRPNLDNSRLKSEFGFRPTKSSAEALQVWWGERRGV
jgi:UDP-glucose 4-epimerase